MVRILGIDPGLKSTGWGVIESEGNNLKFISCGSINTDAKKDLSDRLAELHDELKKVINLYRPDEVAIEETFVNKNAMSSLKLGHARGVLMVTVSLAGLELREYAATLVKKSVVGVGRAEKGQVGMMVKHLLPTAEIKTHDAADSLAVAICHAHHSNSFSEIREVLAT